MIRASLVLGLVTFLALPIGCSSVDARYEGQEETGSVTSPLITTVTATMETVPVSHAGDAADDPCVWIHPTDPSQSTIIGTDKLGGVDVYDLTGKRIQYRPDGRINNIDIRYGFPLGNAKVALVGGTDRTKQALQFWKVEADRTLSPAGSVAVSKAIKDVYGFTLYRSAKTSKYYAFVVDKDTGIIEQYELDGSTGSVKGTRVREMDNGKISEGLVADDLHGHLYASEETVGLWRYGAEPGAGAARTSVVKVGSNDVAADVEGVSIYQRADGTGYLIASSQGNNSYAVFDRLPPNAYRGSFRIGASATIDSTFDTDGIDVTNVNLGPAFPDGAFIAQDGANDGANQNFKVVPWGTIAKSLSLATDTSFDPRAIPGQSTTPGGGTTDGGTADGGAAEGADPAGGPGGAAGGSSGSTEQGAGATSGKDDPAALESNSSSGGCATTRGDAHGGAAAGTIALGLALAFARRRRQTAG